MNSFKKCVLPVAQRISVQRPSQRPGVEHVQSERVDSGKVIVHDYVAITTLWLAYARFPCYWLNGNEWKYIWYYVIGLNILWISYYIII